MFASSDSIGTFQIAITDDGAKFRFVVNAHLSYLLFLQLTNDRKSNEQHEE